MKDSTEAELRESAEVLRIGTRVVAFIALGWTALNIGYNTARIIQEAQHIQPAAVIFQGGSVFSGESGAAKDHAAEINDSLLPLMALGVTLAATNGKNSETR